MTLYMNREEKNRHFFCIFYPFTIDFNSLFNNNYKLENRVFLFSWK